MLASCIFISYANFRRSLKHYLIIKVHCLSRCLSSNSDILSHLFFIVNNFLSIFKSCSFKRERRKRDLNPRAATNDLLPFQGSPFSHLGISPKCLSMTVYKIVVLTHSLVWNGESGIRTHAPLRTNGFQDRLVMTTSISLHERSPQATLLF